MKISLLSTAFVIALVVSCNKDSSINDKDYYVETNKILRTLVSDIKDTTAVYFQNVDSLGEEKIRTVIHPKEPDSVAIYYKSVDSLGFNIPITLKSFQQYKLGENYKVDSLISDEVIDRWNREISQYANHKWNKTERNNLPILNIKPENIQGFYNSENDLKKIIFYSIPFFNKDNNKALVYGYRISASGKIGQLFILKKEQSNWQIEYRGNTFISTF